MADRTAFVARLRTALACVPPIEQIPEASWPLVIAHAAYESGWGSTAQARQARNMFNISAGRSWRGPTLAGGDTEYAPGARVARKIVQQWRSYATDSEAVRDYLRLLTAHRYQSARAALVLGSADAFIALLGPDRAREVPPTGGYYTLPTAQYLRAYRAVLAEVRAIMAKSDALADMARG